MARNKRRSTLNTHAIYVTDVYILHGNMVTVHRKPLFIFKQNTTVHVGCRRGKQNNRYCRSNRRMFVFPIVITLTPVLFSGVMPLDSDPLVLAQVACYRLLSSIFKITFVGSQMLYSDHSH